MHHCKIRVGQILILDASFLILEVRPLKTAFYVLWLNIKEASPKSVTLIDGLYILNPTTSAKYILQQLKLLGNKRLSRSLNTMVKTNLMIVTDGWLLNSLFLAM